jgi:hypothetical protein
MALFVLARVGRGLSARARRGFGWRAGATTHAHRPNADRIGGFHAEAPDDDRPHVGLHLESDVLPASRLTEAEAVIVEALLDGFIRY